MEKEFDIKGVERLTPDNSIDYLSMKLSMDEDGTIYLTNKKKIETMLEEVGVPDIKPTEGVPLTKARLKAAFAKDEPLIIEDIAEFQQNKGRVNWIAQTIHPMLATSSSIYSGMP